MKIAITGINGLLGSSLFHEASNRGYTAIQLDRKDLIGEIPIASICENLSNINCTVLIHCAANTNVEQCEYERLSCYIDNIALTEKLALACQINKIKFVFISSTGIYGNYQDTPYCEYDSVIPTTVHHESKWLAEKLIPNITLNYLIIRTGWLFGGDWDMPKNFVSNRIKEAINSNGTIYSDVSQIGNPTFAYDLACNIYELLKQNYSGTFNCVNQGSVSRFEYVSEIIKLSNLNISVLPNDGSIFNRKAKVSHNESAINLKLATFNLDLMPSWKFSLEKYINSIRHKYE